MDSETLWLARCHSGLALRTLERSRSGDAFHGELARERALFAGSGPPPEAPEGADSFPDERRPASRLPASAIRSHGR